MENETTVDEAGNPKKDFISKYKLYFLAASYSLIALLFSLDNTAINVVIWRRIVLFILNFILSFAILFLLKKIKKSLNLSSKDGIKPGAFSTFLKWIVLIVICLGAFIISTTASSFLKFWTADAGNSQIKQFLINRDKRYEPAINTIRGYYPPNVRQHYLSYDEDSKSYVSKYKKNYSELLEEYNGFEEYNWNIRQGYGSNQIVTFSAKYDSSTYFGKTPISESLISYVEYGSLERLLSDDNLRTIRGDTSQLQRVFNRIEDPGLIQNFYRNGLEYEMEDFLILINDYYRIFTETPDYYLSNNEVLIIEELYEKAKKSDSDLLYLFETLHENNIEEFKYQFSELIYDSFYIPDYKSSEAYIDIEFEIDSIDKECKINKIVISEKNKFRLKPDLTIYVETLLPINEKDPESYFFGYYLWDLKFEQL